jgi:D-3-phosphoglycerate dehydrogenase / 2-oxoglutarate reductase
MVPPRVVITDCDHGTVEPELSVLEGHAEVSVNQCQDAAGLVRLCRDADGVITQYGAFTAEVIRALTRCRVIARYGVGVDTIDLDAATARDIVVANVPDYGTDEVSSHAAALILALLRQIVRYDRAVRDGRWDFRAGAPIARMRGLTLGIVGFGRIGRMVAEKLRPFGLNCLATDPYLTAFPDWVEPVPLETLLERADVVSLHCPLTAETRHLLGEARLRRMKPTAILVNTARGAVVDTAALARALREGWIAGAGLDVLEQEPLPPGHPLTTMDRVLLTPHAAFYSEGSILELKRRVARAVLDVLQGRRPASVVNPEVLGEP